jgi:hypothetical protein
MKKLRMNVRGLREPGMDDDDETESVVDEEARNEALAADETAKFVKAMGVSWRPRPETVSALAPPSNG